MGEPNGPRVLAENSPEAFDLLVREWAPKLTARFEEHCAKLAGKSLGEHSHRIGIPDSVFNCTHLVIIGFLVLLVIVLPVVCPHTIDGEVVGVTALVVIRYAVAVCKQTDLGRNGSVVGVNHARPESRPSAEPNVGLRIVLNAPSRNGLLVFLPVLRIRDGQQRVSEGILAIRGNLDCVQSSCPKCALVHSKFFAQDLARAEGIGGPGGLHHSQRVHDRIARTMDRHGPQAPQMVALPLVAIGSTAW